MGWEENKVKENGVFFASGFPPNPGANKSRASVKLDKHENSSSKHYQPMNRPQL